MDYAQLLYDYVEVLPKEITVLIASYLVKPATKCIATIKVSNWSKFHFHDNSITCGDFVTICKQKNTYGTFLNNTDAPWRGPIIEFNNMKLLEQGNAYGLLKNNTITEYKYDSIADCKCEIESAAIVFDDTIVIAAHGVLRMISIKNQTQKILINKRIKCGHNAYRHDILVKTDNNKFVWCAYNTLFICTMTISELWDTPVDNPASIHPGFITQYHRDIRSIKPCFTNMIMCENIHHETFFIELNRGCFICRVYEDIQLIPTTPNHIAILYHDGFLIIIDESKLIEIDDKFGLRYPLERCPVDSIYKTRDGCLFGIGDDNNNPDESVPLTINHVAICNNLHCKLKGTIVWDFADGTLVSRLGDSLYFYA